MHPRRTHALSLVLVLAGCSVSEPAPSATPAPSERPTPSVPPELPPPAHERTCCAFGMDLRAHLADRDVPFFEIGNIIDPDALGAHIYDLVDDPPMTERNGLVYTCRGGWIDTAHVRDNADHAFYLARRVRPHLADGTTVSFTGSDADTTIVLSPLPSEVLGEGDADETTAAIVEWISYRVALWHEVATWYGADMVSWYPERVSAFSIEDLYSDVLGARLGTEAAANTEVVDSPSYDRFVEERLRALLEDLGARSEAESRGIMGALDGRWWSSARRLPDVHLVMRRAFPTPDGTVAPWLASRAFPAGHAPPIVTDTCRGPTAHVVHVPDHVGSVAIRSLVAIEWRPGSWAGATLTFRDPSTGVHDDDLDRLLEDTHARMECELGRGFDAPAGPIASPSLGSALE